MNNVNSNTFESNFVEMGKLCLLTLSIVSILFIWGGNTDLYLGDEGFLWYGAQRTAFGEIPIRDFMAYDPGRYYFAAGIMNLFDDYGLITLRGAGSIFYGIALLVVLITLQRHLPKQSIFFWVSSLITLLLWSFPKYKVYDTAVSMILVCAFAYLIESPTNRRYLITGIVVGLAATMGRNHGVYALFSGLGATLYLHFSNRNLSPTLIHSIAYSSVGITIGYSPVLALLLLVPEFPQAFLDSITVIFTNGTNITFPVPWLKSGGLVGAFFIGTIALTPIVLAWAIYRHKSNHLPPALLLASALLTLPYAHYAYSRADIAHLALGIFPFLIGSITWISFQNKTRKRVLISVLCLASIIVMLKRHPAWDCNIRNKCVDVEIAGDNIKVQKDEAQEVAFLNEMVKKHAPNQRNFLALPSWPGAYAMFERKSPLWSIYTVWPLSDGDQLNEIERIKSADPGFVIIVSQLVDENYDSNLSNLAPLIYRHITDNYSRIENIETPVPMEVFLAPAR